MGIITLYHGNYNFGGLLQAYALPVAIKKYLGIEAEQIDYAFKFDGEINTKEVISIENTMYKFGIAFFNQILRGKFTSRREAFQQFMKDISHSEQWYEFDSIKYTLSVYNIFICGGDQIWSDFQQTKWFTKEDLRVFTLQFVPEHIKKISYAPSVGILKLTNEYKKELGVGINRLDAISVREKTVLPVLKQITDKPITVVVDPVLLLKDNDWFDMLKQPEKRGKYILCYLLGDSILQRKAVKSFAKKMNCPIITFPHVLQNAVRKCDLFFGDIRDYSAGPREFLGLIKNAEIVITDSYHACVYSMIFKTPFVVYERGLIDGKGNINSRIYDFLEEYHLENQLVTEMQLVEMTDVPKVDYAFAHKHWEKRREESLNYLEKALKEV